MKTNINLLPVDLRRRQLLFDRIRLWSVIWLIGFGVVGNHHWQQCYQLESATRLEDRRKVQHEQLSKLKQETRKSKQKKQDLEQGESLTLDLASDVSPMVVIGVVSRAARSSIDQINVQRLSLERRSVGKSALVSDRILEIEGFGDDNLAVARFVATLRDAQLFERVELKVSKGSKVDGGGSIRSYTVECAF